MTLPKKCYSMLQLPLQTFDSKKIWLVALKAVASLQTLQGESQLQIQKQNRSFLRLFVNNYPSHLHANKARLYSTGILVTIQGRIGNEYNNQTQTWEVYIYIYYFNILNISTYSSTM